MKFIILLGLFCLSVSAAPREALLIGNHNYTYISNLDNPSSNLKRLQESLEALSFHVKVEDDLNSENMAEAIEAFSNRLAKDRETLGFLYYTGHGCQLNHEGYLLPTNVDSQKKLKIKYNALNINEMLETLKSAGNKVNMVFLDACRDVPTGAKGGTKGLGQPTATPKGSLVVYATEAGKTAEDNSNFINALISHVKIPNQNIRNMADNISIAVAKQTLYAQIPVVFTKLLPSVVLQEESIIAQKEERKPKTIKGITTINGLMYQNQPFTKKYTWVEAGKYCKDLSLGGYENWRLPTRVELEKLGKIKFHTGIDYDTLRKWFMTKKHMRFKNLKAESHFISKEFIEQMPSQSLFWTSEEKGSESAWVVSFLLGHVHWYDKSSSHYVLCVR